MSNSNFLWEIILKNLKNTLSTGVIETWFSTSHIDSVDFTTKSITIMSDNSLISNYLKEIHDSKIKEILFLSTNIQFNINYISFDSEQLTPTTEPLTTNTSTPTIEDILIRDGILNSDKPSGTQNFYGKQQLSLNEYQQPKPSGKTLFSTANPSLNKDFTFATFVVGEGNKYAHACAYTAATSPGQTFNPLFIYGGVGLGKTHLLHAIGNELESTYPDMKIQCISSETFINDFISSIGVIDGKNHTYDNEQKFNEKYRDVDALLIDDIQFLADKKETQNKFFHIFNELQLNRKQIVLISDQAPSSLKGLESRLVTRFQQGVTSDITPPDFETRIAILRHKCQQFNITLDDETLIYIANNVSSNIRELEGVLNNIKMMAKTTNEQPTLAIAEQVLKSLISTVRKKIEPSAIIAICSDYYRIPKEVLLSSSRKKEVVSARSVAIYLCRDMTDLSFPNIAKYFNKDHTSILYACNQISTKLTDDVFLAGEIEKLRERIKTS